MANKNKATATRAVIITLGGLGIVVGFVAVQPFASGPVIRHLQLSQQRRRRQVQWSHSRERVKTREQPHDYYLFVLGSGGHTKEMLMMMDDGFCHFENFHRRYLISSGDTMSLDHLTDFENDVKLLCEKEGQSPGTYDTKVVARARRVHQSLLTTPFSALVSLYGIFQVLLSPPANNVGKTLRFPRLIFSNGPATGFFVGLAVHVLKILYIIPEDKCLFVYIESWARITSLSLTGKLFHFTGIADAFAVQHEEVAKRYGVSNAGPLVFNYKRRPLGSAIGASS
ncbi:unnamed protein product [Clonostachys solani]|uniref:UDP-N-acetylglucosamine transferase subunit ALG14 n=1 Tax=Clonostachys solani TaxID=160281 RepID=A0A9N9W5Q3_9HYPO|nr:unnamed protein product [Clonostachys solani]